jgi:hypothetical protein
VCTRSGDEADLEVDAETLGALHLGTTRPLHLLAAGRMRERRPGAGARLDVLTGISEPAWAPEVF